MLRLLILQRCLYIGLLFHGGPDVIPDSPGAAPPAPQVCDGLDEEAVLARLKNSDIIVTFIDADRFGRPLRGSRSASGIRFLPAKDRWIKWKTDGWLGRDPFHSDRGVKGDALGTIRHGADVPYSQGKVATEEELAVACCLTQLRSISLTFSAMGDEALPPIAALPNLIELDLGMTPVGDRGVASIAGCRTLKTVLLNDTQVGDEGVRSLSKLENLENLSLGGTKVTGRTLDSLANSGRLDELYLHATRCSDEAVRLISRCDSLRVLSLGDTDIRGDTLGNLSNLKRLKRVDIGNTRIGSQQIESLKACPRLEILYLDGTDVDDACVHTLRDTSTLRLVDLRRTRVTKKGALELCRSNEAIYVLHESFEGRPGEVLPPEIRVISEQTRRLATTK